MHEQGSASALRYKGYIPGLDVLRGVAILLVLLYHGIDARVPWETTSGWTRWPLLLTAYGASGVQLFFVLSGFLITGILLDTAHSPQYYRKFYVRRVLRIMPAYLLLLIVLKAMHQVGWHFVLAALLYIANMAGLVGARSAEYGTLWSLAVEEQFYLLWPFLVRRISPRALGRMAGWYICGAALFRLLCVIALPGVDTNFKLWFNADLLLAGALVAILLREGRLRRDNIGMLAQRLGGLAAATLAFIVASALLFRNPLWWRLADALHRYVYLFGYTALLLAVIARNRGAEAGQPRAFASRVLSFFGYISYGLYLVHQLIFNTMDHLLQGTPLEITKHPRAGSLLANTVLCVTVSTAIAWLSRRYFEAFFLRQKDRIVPYRDPAVGHPPAREAV